MRTQLSEPVPVVRTTRGSVFSAAQFDVSRLGGFASPIVGVDHYRMVERTFPPHPHAGFAAVTYLFGDSPGAVRNRDSLGHDFVALPGDLIWSQTGRGMLHDEWPAQSGQEVRGLQIFVNSLSHNKSLAPRVAHVRREEMPWHDDTDGNRVRIAVGEYAGLRSFFNPQEPFTLLEVRLRTQIELQLRDHWNALFYVMHGSLAVRSDDGSSRLTASQVGGAHATESAVVTLTADEACRVIVLAGRSLREPIASHGPFVMNTDDEITEAYRRYRAGAMGALHELDASRSNQ